MKSLVLVVAGIVGGIAFVLACSTVSDEVNAGRDASAGPADCAIWQIANLPLANVNLADNSGNIPRADDAVVNGGTVGVWELPAGWEPFAQADSTTVRARRCKP